MGAYTPTHENTLAILAGGHYAHVAAKYTACPSSSVNCPCTPLPALASAETEHVPVALPLGGMFTEASPPLTPIVVELFTCRLHWTVAVADAPTFSKLTVHVEVVPATHVADVTLTFAPQSNPEQRGVMIPDWKVNGTETASKRIAATTTIRMFLRLLDAGFVSSAFIGSTHRLR